MFAKILTPLAVLAIAGCAAPTSAQPTSSPAASATAPATITTPGTPAHYAVIVHNFVEGTGSTYTVALVGADGRTAAAVNATRRSVPSSGWPFQVSSLSTTSTRVYYLDGDADIRYLRPDGSGGLATHLTVPAGAAAAFAVSPDDSRIAVSIVDRRRYPNTTRMYVQDLAGGGHQVDLLKPTTTLEWPLGWHDGRLVVAFGLNAPPQQTGEGFISGHGFEVLDASSGRVLADLCRGLDGVSPPVAGGVICFKDLAGRVASWTGTATPVPVVGGCEAYGALSPDGGEIATLVTAAANGGCGGGPAPISLVGLDGRITPTQATGMPEGWLDGDHFIDSPIEPIPPIGLSWTVYDIAAGTSTSIQAPGFFAGTVPGSL